MFLLFPNRKKLKHLEKLGDSELSPDFVEEVREFLQFVYAKCPVKKLETGQQLNGRSKWSCIFMDGRKTPVTRLIWNPYVCKQTKLNWLYSMYLV